MEKHGVKIKKFLLAIILVMLLLPLLQQHLKFYTPEKLHGAIVPAPEAWFSIAGWFSGNYQETYSAWFNENFGFREDMVRVHNQAAYNLYGEAKANGVVIGKENYLYELNYLKTYTGQDFVGMVQVNGIVSRITALQDSLAKKGVTLVVCFAPGKASFFPEYIPDSYGPASDSTNYKILSKMLAQNNVNLIDYNKWFMEMKGKTEYPLYPKTGIHWSRYGSLLAFDSLISYIEHKRNVDMPDVIWEGVDWSDSLRSPDEDIGLGMNLMWPLKGYKMGYPRYHFEDTTGKAKVKMMTISDSFFWEMFDMGIAPTPFSEVSFYYYNKEVYRTGGRPQEIAYLENTMNDAQQHDVVVLMATEATVWGIGWGFVEDAYDTFVIHKPVKSEDHLVQKYEAMIRMDEKWMEDIRNKAAGLNIPVDSMIRIDARYMADEEMKQK